MGRLGGRISYEKKGTHVSSSQNKNKIWVNSVGKCFYVSRFYLIRQTWVQLLVGKKFAHFSRVFLFLEYLRK
jgi:hypothetical protein